MENNKSMIVCPHCRHLLEYDDTNNDVISCPICTALIDINNLPDRDDADVCREEHCATEENEVGTKLKQSANIIWVIGIIAATIVCCADFGSGGHFMACLIDWFSYCFAVWLSGGFIYAMGEFISIHSDIRDELHELNRNKVKK